MSLIISGTYQHHISGDGPEDAKIVILTDMPGWNDSLTRRPLSDYAGKLLLGQFTQAGIRRTDIRIESICERLPTDRKFYSLDPFEQNFWREDCLRRLKQLSPNVIVPLGEVALQLVTGKKSIGKWHMSILPAVAGLSGVKTIPLLHPDYTLKVFKDIPFLTVGAQRVQQEMNFPEIRTTKRTFITKPNLVLILDWIERALKEAEWLSFDIETGSDQIICIGFSYLTTEAICIPTLPQDWSDPELYVIWSAIDKLMGSAIQKVAQNGIYDCTFLSRYGIRVRNLAHDTMVAQRVLHAELPVGLDTIARLYTREPYWKDEGKSWGINQNIDQLYVYNCKDVCLTLEAAHAQRVDLLQRGLDKLFYETIMAYHVPACQMCWTGLPIREHVLIKLREETEVKVAELQKTLDEKAHATLGRVINSRSVKDKKELLKALGYRLPMKDGRESTDYESLLKLRLKDPDSPVLDALLKLSKEQKKLSSYLNYNYDSDKQMRFTLRIGGTETLRWAGSKDPFDNGINPQTIPSGLKGQFGYD